MENIVKVGIVVYAALFLNVGTAVAGKDCTNTSTYADHRGSNTAGLDENQNPKDGYCYQTPTNMDVKIYEVGICTAHAKPNDKTACTLLFSDANGQLVNLSVGSSLSLSGEISVTEGTYSHAYILMSNETAIKTVIQFSTPRTAPDADGSSGTYCYTNGDSWNTPNINSVMSCGDSASAAKSSPETIGLGPTYSIEQYTVTMEGEQVVSNLYMTDADGTTKSDSEETSKRILGSQILVNQVTVTPSTSNIDVSFVITDGVAVGMNSNDGPYDAVLEGLKFKITAN